MAKVAIFEGCKECTAELEAYGQLIPAGFPAYAVETAKGAGAGAGVAVAIEMMMRKVFPAVPYWGRFLAEGAAGLGLAYYLRRRYPDISTGIALGVASIIVYRLICRLLGRALSVTSGFGTIVAEPEEYGQEALVSPEEVTTEYENYGTVIAEPTEEEVLVE